MSIPIKPETPKTWAEFSQVATRDFPDKWYFRGVLDNWGLETSLERACRAWNVRATGVPKMEKRLLREFKRAFPVVETPAFDDDLAWLALMQHHGAPTRLLDWTLSPFVAAFFALRVLLTCRDKRRKAAVWALSTLPVSNKTVKGFLPCPLQPIFEGFSKTRKGRYFRELFLEQTSPFAFVTPVNPYFLHERLVVQQGTFLCPGDVSLPFEKNLLRLPDLKKTINLRKILLPRSSLSDALLGLRRMNITHASLFPGVDGYARSMLHRIDFLRDPRLFLDSTDY